MAMNYISKLLYNLLLFGLVLIGMFLFIHHAELYPDSNVQAALIALYFWGFLKAWHFLEERAEFWKE